MTASELRDAFGFEPADEPPATVYCLACAAEERGKRGRITELEEGIRQASTDLRSGVAPHVVAVNLDALEGPF